MLLVYIIKDALRYEVRFEIFWFNYIKIFQWPPLSAPTRSIIPSFLRVAICFSIPFTLMPMSSLNSFIVKLEFSLISPIIFSLLFSLLFSLPLRAVFRIVCAETLTGLKSVTVKIETVQNTVSGKKVLTFHQLYANPGNFEQSLVSLSLNSPFIPFQASSREIFFFQS